MKSKEPVFFMCLKAKFFGPTNFKGARIKVEGLDNDKKKYFKSFSWDYSLNDDQNYVNAFKEFLSYYAVPWSDYMMYHTKEGFMLFPEHLGVKVIVS